MRANPTLMMTKEDAQMALTSSASPMASRRGPPLSRRIPHPLPHSPARVAPCPPPPCPLAWPLRAGPLGEQAHEGAVDGLRLVPQRLVRIARDRVRDDRERIVGEPARPGHGAGGGLEAGGGHRPRGGGGAPR